MICVSLGDMDQIQEVRQMDVSLVELRLDLIRTDISRLFPGLPDHWKIIATCRPGPYGEEERRSMLREAVEKGASFVDLELETDPTFLEEMVALAHGKGCRVIVSYHDFQGTPGEKELADILHSCFRSGADIAKVATTILKQEDITRLHSLYRFDGRKVIIGMGAMGKITRIMAPYLGSEFTFAAVGKASLTAPGQYTVEELLEIYKHIDRT